MLGFGFISDWMRNWESFGPVTKRREEKINNHSEDKADSTANDTFFVYTLLWRLIRASLQKGNWVSWVLFIIVCFPVIKCSPVKVAYSKLAFIYKFVHSATSTSVWKGTLLCTRNFRYHWNSRSSWTTIWLRVWVMLAPKDRWVQSVHQSIKIKTLFKCLFFWLAIRPTNRGHKENDGIPGNRGAQGSPCTRALQGRWEITGSSGFFKIWTTEQTLVWSG